MSISRTKGIIFRLIPSLILIVVLMGAELLLRRFSPSLANPFVREITVDGLEWLQINRSYLKKYFSAHTPMVPEFKPSLLRKSKPENMFRVICLGGSSMFGTPYTMTGTLPGIVRRQLRSLHPGREIEVVNLGASAINSNVVRDLMGEVVRLEPDCVLIYMGHNEFYGPDGISATLFERWFPFLTRWKYHLREFRLVEALRQMASGDEPPADRSEARNLMKQVSQGSTVALNSEEADRIFSLFGDNLSDILDVLAAHHVPVIVSDVTSNLEFPPFIAPPLTAQESEGLRQAGDARDQGKLMQAVNVLDDLRAGDTLNAQIAYACGLAHRAAGDSSVARSLLVLAKDLDLLKFRAPGRINETIRSVCAAHKVPIVSADRVFSALSKDAIQGDNLFWEHLHPNLFGYYAMAQMFLEAMDRGILQPERSSPLPFNADSLHVCWLDRAYADLAVQNLTGSWPFENYRRTMEVFPSADSVEQNIALAAYRRTMLWDEACYNSAEHFWRSGAIRDARTTYDALIEERPYDFYAHYLLGNLLNGIGKTEDAIGHYRISIRSNPAFPNAHLDLGLLEINRGKFDEAIVQLETASFTSSTRPAFRANAFYGLGAAYANKGEYEKALGYLRKALEERPGYSDAERLEAAIRQERATSHP